MIDKYLTVYDVSMKLKVHPETVRRWIRNGKLKAVRNSKKGGFLIEESEVLRFCKYANRYRLSTNEEPAMDYDEIFKAMEFHISEIVRLEQILKSGNWA